MDPIVYLKCSPNTRETSGIILDRMCYGIDISLFSFCEKKRLKVNPL